MLLRYFVNFYDMEIIEEEAFLYWKEDVNQEYPGKGKALFQVWIKLYFCLHFKVSKKRFNSNGSVGEGVGSIVEDGFSIF